MLCTFLHKILNESTGIVLFKLQVPPLFVLDLCSIVVINNYLYHLLCYRNCGDGANLLLRGLHAGLSQGQPFKIINRWCGFSAFLHTYPDPSQFAGMWVRSDQRIQINSMRIQIRKFVILLLRILNFIRIGTGILQNCATLRKKLFFIKLFHASQPLDAYTCRFCVLIFVFD